MKPIETRDEAFAACEACDIPDHMWDAVAEYVVDHREAGGFFMAVMSNDLVGAAAVADQYNARRLWSWANLLYNHVPVDAWGSPEKVKKWLAAGEVKTDA